MKRRIKRIIGLSAAWLLVVALCSSTVSAAGEDLAVSMKTVILDKGQDTFKLTFSIPEITPEYAGFEFHLQMSERVSLVSAAFNDSLSIAATAKKSAEGNTVIHSIAFIADENIYNNAMDFVTLTLNYSGDTEEVLNVTGARVSRKETGGGTTPMDFYPDLTITVSRKASEGGGSSGSGSGGSGSSGSGNSSGSPDADNIIDETTVSYYPSLPSLGDLDGHWAKSEIESAVSLGFVSGYPDGTFRPDQAVTRAEFVGMLVRGLSIETAEGETFPDTEGHWASQMIKSAVGSGAVGGYPDGTFKPDDNMSRQELAVALAKAAGFTASEQPDTAFNGSLTFSDGDKIGSWALVSIQALYAEGIMQGYEDGEIRPLQNVTRAEAAALLLRVIN